MGHESGTAEHLGRAKIHIARKMRRGLSPREREGKVMRYVLSPVVVPREGC